MKDRRLGLVGWATDSGVGREFIDALNHLPVSSAFVLENPVKPTRAELLERVPHQRARPGDLDVQMGEFLDRERPEVILTWEVPGSWSFPDLWKRKGVRWVHVVHWDWFASHQTTLWRTAELIAPNDWCRRELLALGLPSTMLAVPVDASRFPFRLRSKASRFISLYGYGGPGHRRGLPEIQSAWSLLRQSGVSAPLDVFAQAPIEDGSGDFEQAGLRVHVGNVPDPCGIYERGDVAVQVSRYEGVGLSLLEAQAIGLPVIAVDAEPMNVVAPDLTVPAGKQGSVPILGKVVRTHEASPEGLARKVTEVLDRDISDLSRRARERVEREFSWDVLGPAWRDVVTRA